MMLADPSTKYAPYAAIDVGHRQWPYRRITRHPVWLSTDLRDGNQALVSPMTADQKLRFFHHLLKCNFKEIEIGYPAASDTEFDFVRSLIDDNEVPDDVWVQVMTPARVELIHRTFDAIAGARHVIVSLFNSTAPCFREVVFRKSKDEIIDMAVHHTIVVRQLALEHRERHGTRFRLAYGVEAFSQTEPEYVVEICTAVKRAWGSAGPGDDRIIYNLPSTVETAPPNHYADQIEYFCTHMDNRDEIMVSLHCHNDRGTAIAATELGLLAGADRVEGCLLGNGERSGNVDLVAVALNMYTQGVPCGLDFSDLPATAALVTALTALPVHPRHPYAGELIFTAFSGQHQDGIKKGLEARARRGDSDARWAVPYLPLDPADVGRTYEAVIRVNSQSGKGGIAYVVTCALGFDLPRAVQQDFYRVVQGRAESTGAELSPGAIVAAFRETYHFPGCGLQPWMSLVDLAVSEHGQPANGAPAVMFTCVVSVNGSTYTLQGEGVDLSSAFVETLHQRLGVNCCLVEAHTAAAVNEGTPAHASFVLLSEREEERSPSLTTWGVSVDTDAPRSAVLAVISAVNRALCGGLGAAPAAGRASRKDVLRVLEVDYEMSLPGALHDTLARFCADKDTSSSAQTAARFVAHYCSGPTAGNAPGTRRGIQLCSFTIHAAQGGLRLEATVELRSAQVLLCSKGRDALSCLLAALGDHFATSLRLCMVELSPPTARACFEGTDRAYVAFVRISSHANERGAWGISADADITSSMLKAALVAAVNCGLGVDVAPDGIEL